MRICYLNHDTRDNTGAGRFYNALSRAVRTAMPGVEIEVLTSENLLYPNKLKLLLALPAIRKVISQCDIIHALDGWPYGVIAALTALGLKKKLVITAVGTGAVQPLHDPLRRKLMAWAYKKADRVVAVSTNTRKEIQKVIPDLKIELINHGVDVSKLQTVSAGYQAEAQKLKPYILSVGTLKKRKGFIYSIEAFAKIANRFADLKYVIVGGGPEKPMLDKKIQELGIEGRVVYMTGLHQDFVNALYQNAELFILLSQNFGKDIEGFGLVFLEAAAAGLPVIGTRETGAVDAVADGKNGFLAPQGDAEEAAKAMAKLLADKNLKESFAKESVKFAQSMNWEKAAQSYKTIYASLV